MIEWKLAWRPYQMLNVELETCTEIFSVYPRLFEVFFSSFLSLPECPKYKPSITLLSCSFYAWIKLDFCEDILGNQSNYCDWYFLMYNLYFWCIMMWNQMSMIDQKKKWFVFKLRKLIEKKKTNRSLIKILKVFSTFFDEQILIHE